MAKKEKLLKAVNKTRDKILLENAKEYFSPFIKKSWYKKAINSYIPFICDLKGILDDYCEGVINCLDKSKKPFTGENKNIKKASNTKYKTNEYLDSKYNEVVVDDIKDTLKELQKKFIKKLSEFYTLHVAKGIVKDLLDIKDLPFNFNKANKFTKKYLKNKVIHWANTVAETTEKVIKRELVNGYEEGKSVYDITQAIRKHTMFKTSRAEKIARTEIMASCNYVDYTTYNITDSVTGYKWQTCMDRRVRPTHTNLQGVYRAKGEPFQSGNSRLMFPGDSSLGASASEIVMCRCWLEPVHGETKKPKNASSN